ncbi:hypothetical protein D477_008128 [Arthrobacter crystallopoietes BAB-32]|uniref:Uncharacterized protein n=1 Tax=Arthrobacter crystallopoietes BAB-32 TaxID=1246476 RepID=N1V098_9MICC|nr:hypothetical protein [Arthrobacter crystallopoietes]EMY34720.1 hypothetical protein D477_008128 [Arthrobacter crystallopoietes BAB-32]
MHTGKATAAGSRSLMRFRRARMVLALVAAFWLWLGFGGADAVGLLFASPKDLVLALYAGAVLVPVSVLAGLMSAAIVVADRPRRAARPRVEPPQSPDLPHRGQVRIPARPMKIPARPTRPPGIGRGEDSIAS